ncbi:uncharacterized protein [Dermacentor albipictus]|uniref:uncharacterized protein isoform X10 n=1 Tax=Dermacentor albipictus TaxID=60249 RepID=UPI0031FDCCAE
MERSWLLPRWLSRLWLSQPCQLVSILRNLSVKVTQKIIQDVLRRENVRTGCRDPKVISAIEMKVFLNFTTNMRNRDLKVLRNGLMKGKTMLQFSDCFTRLYE